MSTTHVFIVDINTFKYHLEYSFAGTGSKDDRIDFNNNPVTQLKHTKENNLVSMLSDSQRIRRGDYVLFYLQQNLSQSIQEGKFYGIFKAKEDVSFLDNNDKNQFLKKELRKSLTFRTLIEPFEVYAKGITEWEALDEIKYIHSPNQMLWSLIYRKLKGNRGNTMITIYESERLFKMIRNKNNNQPLSCENFTFDKDRQEIICSFKSHKYQGRKEKINILPRLIKKYRDNKSFEQHLQAYIVQNIGRNTNPSLDKALLNNLNVEWIGNEVSCGVGMQRIDILLSLNVNETKRIILPIELKSVEASVDNVHQIQRYIDWLEQYYIPNRVSDIYPVLISKEIKNKNSSKWNALVDSFNHFNSFNKQRAFSLKYIEYFVEKNDLIFYPVSYN